MLATEIIGDALDSRLRGNDGAKRRHAMDQSATRWIPAQTRIDRNGVIPAEAGIQRPARWRGKSSATRWIPACAGMTVRSGDTRWINRQRFVIPAEAGIQRPARWRRKSTGDALDSRLRGNDGAATSRRWNDGAVE
ncbi:MAG TPA: hypothetical protein VFE24_16015 [Pirellulales bacterium]|jgi:hypothetical protein|nr:hypothetical protein [Pirellulales bacterium]